MYQLERFFGESFRRRWAALFFMGLVPFLTAHIDAGENSTQNEGLAWNGFTEPLRTTNVAADEIGIVTKVHVREGQTVTEGQPIAQLNEETLRALLAIARQNMNARGRIEAALAEVQLKNSRLVTLGKLRLDGHARQEEVDRARMEAAVADANLKTAREDELAKRLEYRKIEIQLKRRQIKAPSHGVITAVHKQAGEFVAPNNPDIVTIVQIDKLLANFTLSGSAVSQLEAGKKVTVYFPTGNRNIIGTVQFISPVTDAESGTVRVKVEIDNTTGRFRSGERCLLKITPDAGARNPAASAVH